jgi:hypothetical protein
VSWVRTLEYGIFDRINAGGSEIGACGDGDIGVEASDEGDVEVRPD